MNSFYWLNILNFELLYFYMWILYVLYFKETVGFCLLLWEQSVFKNSSLFFNILFHWRMHGCVLSHFSRVWLFATLWTVAHQAPLSMGFFWQEYWSGLSCSSPGDLPNPGIELTFLSLMQWTWTWANIRSWWRTGKPGVLQSMGLQRVRYNWGTEQQKALKYSFKFCCDVKIHM